MRITESVNGPERHTRWQAINWRTANRIVRNLRQRIFRASQEGEGTVKQVICSSRVRCKPHARFQGGRSGATFSCYPTAGSPASEAALLSDARVQEFQQRSRDTERDRVGAEDQERAVRYNSGSPSRSTSRAGLGSSARGMRCNV